MKKILMISLSIFFLLSCWESKNITVNTNKTVENAVIKDKKETQKIREEKIVNTTNERINQIVTEYNKFIESIWDEKWEMNSENLLLITKFRERIWKEYKRQNTAKYTEIKRLENLIERTNWAKKPYLIATFEKMKIEYDIDSNNFIDKKFGIK